MTTSIIYVGLDVHKNSIAIAIADEGRNAEVRFYGVVGGTLADLDGALKKIGGKGKELHVVYEAGPCGYDIYRYLTAKGIACKVCSPAHIPKTKADRIKTDARDALSLARLHRAGELTYVFVPRAEDEAMRDLTRAREDAQKAKRVAQQQLGALLLRLGFRYTTSKQWTDVHFRWLADLKMPTPAQQVVFQEYIQTLGEAQERVKRLLKQIEELIPSWRLAPVYQAIQSLRGVSTIVAVTTLAELGDVSRFSHARQLSAFLGLVPSEASSGEKIKRMGITKTGNGHVRRVLTEAAHAYSYPARISRDLLKRQEGVSMEARSIAWKCQTRLCARFRRLKNKGKSHNVVVTAIARELASFIWAIAKQTPIAV